MPKMTSWTVALLTGVLTFAAGLGTSDAAATAAITLNQTEFKAGDTLTVGVQATNPSDSPTANLYLGVVMPDGGTALFIAPGGTTAPVSLGDPANFRSLQPAPPGFTLNAPNFSQFTWPADGLPIGTYTVFVALTQASNGALLALDVKPFTYSPRNVFLPMFRRPFNGEPILSSFFDHNVPREFVDMNGFTINYAGEQAPFLVDGHWGYDFPMPEGTPLVGVADGTVTVAGELTPFLCPLLGNQVVGGELAVNIRHTAPNGESFESVYHHLSRIDVQIGQHVTLGQPIGLSGNTGCSGGPHLHFGVLRRSHTNSGSPTAVDPYGLDYPQIDPWTQDPQGAQSVYLWLPGQAPALRYRPIAHQLGCSGCGTEPVVMTGVNYAGVRDDLNRNNEFVELTLDTQFNSGSTTRNLTGYTLKNLAGGTYTFPAGFLLREGQPVRIYSGSGINGATALFWGRTTGAWNNFSECIQLFNAAGIRHWHQPIGSGVCP